jgi:hypothetical protein
VTGRTAQVEDEREGDETDRDGEAGALRDRGGGEYREAQHRRQEEDVHVLGRIAKREDDPGGGEDQEGVPLAPGHAQGAHARGDQAREGETTASVAATTDHPSGRASPEKPRSYER